VRLNPGIPRLPAFLYSRWFPPESRCYLNFSSLHGNCVLYSLHNGTTSLAHFTRVECAEPSPAYIELPLQTSRKVLPPLGCLKRCCTSWTHTFRRAVSFRPRLSAFLWGGGCVSPTNRFEMPEPPRLLSALIGLFSVSALDHLPRSFSHPPLRAASFQIISTVPAVFLDNSLPG